MEEEGAIRGMLHLNPYDLSVYGNSLSAPYVVAVATEEGYRGRGIMARVLAAALCEEAKKGEAFAFLIPADPRFYTSAGFCPIPNDLPDGFSFRGEGGKKDGKLQNDKAEEKWHGEVGCEVVGCEDASWQLTSAEEGDFPCMVRFANQILAARKDIYIPATDEYYRRKSRELAIEKGELLLLWKKEILPKEIGAEEANGRMEEGRSLQGILAYAGEEEPELLDAILNPALAEEISWDSSDADFMKEAKQIFLKENDFFDQKTGKELTCQAMPLMVRILNLKAFVSVWKREKPLCLRVLLTDSIIPENNGAFAIEIDRKGGRIYNILPEEATCTMEIGGLTELLFSETTFHMREWV